MTTAEVSTITITFSLVMVYIIMGRGGGVKEQSREIPKHIPKSGVRETAILFSIIH